MAKGETVPFDYSRLRFKDPETTGPGAGASSDLAGSSFSKTRLPFEDDTILSEMGFQHLKLLKTWTVLYASSRVTHFPAK